MNDKQIEELRDFIVSTNQEYNFLHNLNDKKELPTFKKWLGL